MARAIVNVPAQAKRGEIIEIKTLVGHVMETGFRRTQTRRADSARHHHGASSAPTTATEIFRAEFHPAIAANPLRRRSRTVATESGTLEFRWTGDNGFAVTEPAAITVV